jgi:RNA ligase
MDYFPNITHIDQVLPFIKGKEEFFILEKEGYIVIDYRYSDKNTFDHPMLLECRGLKFKSDGTILARPLHKFFNLGEKENIEDINWGKPFVFVEKLDGSMIHPAMLNNELVFMTMQGVTTIAKEAFNRADLMTKIFSQVLLKRGYTPIFEYTAPDNKIVVQYDDSKLTLTAIRETVSGKYFTYDEMRRLAGFYNIDYAKTLPKIPCNGDSFRIFQQQKDIEGCVIQFDNGHRLKVKTDDYVLKHSILDLLKNEKLVFKIIVNNELDDLLPIIDPKIQPLVTDFRDKIYNYAEQDLSLVRDFITTQEGVSRKDFALNVNKNLPKRLQYIAFKMLDGRECLHLILSNMYENRKEYDLSWKMENVPNKDIFQKLEAVKTYIKESFNIIKERNSGYTYNVSVCFENAIGYNELLIFELTFLTDLSIAENDGDLTFCSSNVLQLEYKNENKIHKWSLVELEKLKEKDIFKHIEMMITTMSRYSLP